MVSGPNGMVLYDPNGGAAVMTFQAAPTATTATTLQTTQLTLASGSPMATGVGVSGSPVVAQASATMTPGVNNTSNLKDEAAMQAGMDSE